MYSEKRTAYEISQQYYLPKQGDPFKRKIICPECSSRNSAWRAKCFTLFVNRVSGEPLDQWVGYCDYAGCRLNASNQPLTPYSFLLANSHILSRMTETRETYYAEQRPRQTQPERPIRIDPNEDTLPTTAMWRCEAEGNNLYRAFARLFARRFPMLGTETVKGAVYYYMFLYYMVGTYTESETCRNLIGSAIFWEIDEQMQTREGKIMQYDEHTAGRIKKAGYINWITNDTEAHRRRYKGEGMVREHCLFGLHLLCTERREARRVIVVESQKSAIGLSIYEFLNQVDEYRIREFGESARLPETEEVTSLCLTRIKEVNVYMATGGSMMLSERMVEPIMDKEILLLPDAGGAAEKWRKWAERQSEKSAEMNMNISVDMTMQRAMEAGICGENADLLDLLING